MILHGKGHIGVLLGRSEVSYIKNDHSFINLLL
jgi:hypothetical protein